MNSKRFVGLVWDALLAGFLFLVAVHLHMGDAIWSMPANMLYKYSFLFVGLFVGLGLWTYIPYLHRIHYTTITIFGFFVIANNVLYWPCMILMGRHYPLPLTLLITNSILLWVGMISWRLLIQWSIHLIRTSHNES